MFSDWDSSDRIVWEAYDTPLDMIVDNLPKSKGLIGSRKGNKGFQGYHKCNYFENGKLLGQTYDIIILTDFDYLKPNIACQIIETLRSGKNAGILVLSLKSSLRNFKFGQKYQNHLFDDKELVPSPLLERIKFFLSRFSNVITSTFDKDKGIKLLNYECLDQFKSQFNNNKQVLTRNYDKFNGISLTEDQLNFVEETKKVIDKKLNGLHILIAARGRGKTYALSLLIILILYNNSGIILCLFKNYSTIEVIKENINFIIKSCADFKKIDIKQNLNFVSIESYREAVRFNNYKFIIIDEIATIGIKKIKEILKKFSNALVILSTTVHGYEGTGRNFNLKILGGLKKSKVNHRIFNFNTSIRYKNDDLLEKLLYKIYLLDSKSSELGDLLINDLDKANNSDFLINMIEISSLLVKEEHSKLLSDIMDLFTSAHYKNSPDDLLLLSESNNHFLIYLTLREYPNTPLCAAQISIEAGLTAELLEEYVSSDKQKHGNLIGWKIYEYFDPPYNLLPVGIRIVRIATRTDLQRKRLATKLVNFLVSLIQNKAYDIPINNHLDDFVSNLKNKHSPKWLGVSFGLNEDLYKFWSSIDLFFIHISLSVSAESNEPSCIMIHKNSSNSQYYINDFNKRFLNLMHLPSYNNINSVIIAEHFFKLLKDTNFNVKITSNIFNLDFQDIGRIKKFRASQVDSVIVKYLIVPLLTKFLLFSCVGNISIFDLIIMIGFYGQVKSTEKLAQELNIKSEKINSRLQNALKSLFDNPNLSPFLILESTKKHNIDKSSVDSKKIKVSNFKDLSNFKNLAKL